MDKAGFDRWSSDPNGRTFGPYTLVKRLGVGGMAETFEAIRGGPGGFSQRVCLKLVLPFFREREDFVALFEREARLAAKLRHSNVVGVIDFGEIDGVTYMALELVDGTDLATLLDSEPGRRVPAEFAALIGHDLAAALEHAHDPRRDGSSDGPADNAIVHRDISPSNVLVSQRGEIILTDFGVAKAITGTARQQSAVKGKVPYMSPEQLRSEPLDGRSDLFALGVVLYEALAGQRPFLGEHDPATIMLILDGDRPDLLQIAPDTPPGFAQIVEQLLEPDRDARPASASALLDMLDPFVPSPRTRRELGKVASVLRASRTTVTPRDPTDGSAPTDPRSRLPSDQGSGVGPLAGAPVDGRGSEEPPAPMRAESRPAHGGLAVAALLVVLGALALWFVLRPTDSAPVETVSSEDASVAAVAEPGPTDSIDSPAAQAQALESDDAVSVAQDDGSLRTDAGTVAAPPVDAAGSATEPAVKPGRLSVVVFPWGDVWINGKRSGTAPVENLALPPGRYRVGAGRGKPAETRVVRLRAGQRRTVEFDLSQ